MARPLATPLAPRAALALALVTAAVAPDRVRACSVCACGDPIVTAAEGHGDADGEVRLTLETEYLRQEQASEEDPAEEETLDQYTVRLGAVYSPLASLNLIAAVPFVRKHLDGHSDVPGGHAGTEETGLGDVEVGARWFAWETVDFGARRRQGVALSLGTSIPTGENDARDEDGARIDEHGQVGTGAFAPYAGVSYRLRQDAWSALVAVSGRLRLENGEGYAYGDALLFSAGAQWTPVGRIALGLALEGRSAGRDREEGAAVPNTGGLVLAAAPSVFVNAYRGLWLNARAQLPVHTDMRGDQTIGPTVTVGLSYQVR